MLIPARFLATINSRLEPLGEQTVGCSTDAADVVPGDLPKRVAEDLANSITVWLNEMPTGRWPRGVRLTCAGGTARLSFAILTAASTSLQTKTPGQW